MSQIKTKICGITRTKDAETAVGCSADAIGLNFYRGSKRFVSPDEAANIASSIKDQIAMFGVFVNSPLAEIKTIFDVVGLTHVQLHGDEDPKIVANIRSEIPQARIFRAIRIQNNDRSAAQQEIDRWQSEGIDGLLLDAASTQQYGGTGSTLDWQAVTELRIAVRWLLAGGLNPENVSEAIRLASPTGVDVASGVETAPGIKDSILVRDFIHAANSTLNQ